MIHDSTGLTPESFELEATSVKIDRDNHRRIKKRKEVSKGINVEVPNEIDRWIDRWIDR